MRYQTKEVELDPSAKLALVIANAEACSSGKEYVEPVHLLLAALHVVDDNYDDAARSIRLSPEEMVSVAEVAAQCRTMLAMTDEEVTAARRGLRKLLTEQDEPRPLRHLSHSSELTYLLQKSVRRMVAEGAAALSLAYLLGETFDALPKEAVLILRGRKSPGPAPSD